jgi:hypothetical protein
VRLEGEGDEVEPLELEADSVIVMGVIAARLRFVADDEAPVEDPI